MCTPETRVYIVLELKKKQPKYFVIRDSKKCEKMASFTS